MNASEARGRKPPVALRQNEQERQCGELRAGRLSELESIEGLLEFSGLPVEGVRKGLGQFFVYAQGGTLLGAVGLELYGTAGLLRSTTVVACARRRGIGAALIEHAVARAQEQGCTALYLLTLNAQHYFRRFGFVAMSRDKAPKAIQASPEFTTLCPASAVLMRKTLGA